MCSVDDYAPIRCAFSTNTFFMAHFVCGVRVVIHSIMGCSIGVGMDIKIDHLKPPRSLIHGMKFS